MSAKILKGPELTRKPPNSSIGQFFFDAAQKFQDRTFQIDGHSGCRETFASIKKRSTSVAIQMQKRGVTSNDVVLLCSPSTLDAPVPIIASCFLGAKVGSLDPTLSVRHVSHLLGLVKPKMIFVHEASVGLIEQSLNGANLKSDVVVFGNSTKYPTFSYFDTVQEKQDEFRPTPVDANEGAIIFFSSGTTGLAKAICHSNSSFLHVAFQFFQSSIGLDVILSFTSFYWITAMLFFTSTFINGGHRVLLGNDVVPEDTFEAIEKYRVTYLFLSPVLTYNLTNFENWNHYDTSSLYFLLTTGTPISYGQFRKLSTIFKNTYIVGCYGQTELGVISLLNPLTDGEMIPNKSSSSGKVIAGIILKVVDLESGQILGPKQQGEICVKSPSRMIGYYNSDATGISEVDGYLKTGDLGYYDNDNCLYIIDRTKEMFKYRSWHIVPSAIEQVLLEHPAIKEAAVFGYPISKEEGEAPAAAIVFNEGCRVSEKDIKDFVAGKVSDVERLRGGVYILEKLKKTVTGKTKRREIRNSILESLLSNDD